MHYPDSNPKPVVYAQVHYLGDPWRGSVWEEAIINCPRHIQILGMSATVKNPGDLGGWISRVSRTGGAAWEGAGLHLAHPLLGGAGSAVKGSG